MMSEIRRYVMALLFVAAACVASLFLQRFFAYPFLFLIFAAVMASAWFGGIAPGLVAVFISTLAVDYFFVPPLHSFAINATDSSYFAAFVICAVVASWVSSSKKKTEEALRESRDQLEARVAERTAELEKSLMELRENERQRVLLQSEKSALIDQLAFSSACATTPTRFGETGSIHEALPSRDCLSRLLRELNV